MGSDAFAMDVTIITPTTALAGYSTLLPKRGEGGGGPLEMCGGSRSI